MLQRLGWVVVNEVGEPQQLSDAWGYFTPAHSTLATLWTSEAHAEQSIIPPLRKKGYCVKRAELKLEILPL